MRAFVVAFGLVALTTAADAKSRPKAKPTAAKHAATSAKRIASDKRDDKRADKSKRKRGAKRVAHAERRSSRDRVYIMPRGPITGQSLGAPWAGRLHDAAELQPGPGYVIRRPWRAYGTTSTVAAVQHIVADVADRFYDTHAIAIGDISAAEGGRVSDHSSHQSGRDVDIGLIFKTQPPGYPASFVAGTADNLDLEATFVLVEEFAKTHDQPGGVQVIFLDFKVQGLLYNWALANGEDPAYLAKLFQFPSGRGESAGIVRHEPNHADHIHVRFQCPPDDALCK
jgi:murein endopeptidase